MNETNVKLKNPRNIIFPGENINQTDQSILLFYNITDKIKINRQIIQKRVTNI